MRSLRKTVPFIALLFLVGIVAASGCSPVKTPVPTPDVAATVEAAVATAMATQATQADTPTTTPAPLRVIPPDPAVCGPPPTGAPPGDCGLTITIQWENIQLDDGRIYLLASVGGDKWWIPGTGISIAVPSGQEDITDGSYSTPGQSVKLFACLTTETYWPGKNFVGRPTCTLSSPDILVQTQ